MAQNLCRCEKIRLGGFVSASKFLDELRAHHSSQAEAAHRRLATQAEKLARDMRSQRELAHLMRQERPWIEAWQIPHYDEEVEFRGWFAAEFHLRQLCRLHPSDEKLQQRLRQARQFLAEQDPLEPELAPDRP